MWSTVIVLKMHVLDNHQSTTTPSPQAKQLLAPLPCLVNGEPSSASLLSVLGGIQALQPAVVDMALDFMVAHCKVHRHQCGASGRRAEGGEGTTSPTTPAASSPQRAQKGASLCASVDILGRFHMDARLLLLLWETWVIGGRHAATQTTHGDC